ncbi:MAG: hypothetical protein ACFFE8_00295 [Candidatus Heimdallarchaeota archaeon]
MLRYRSIEIIIIICGLSISASLIDAALTADWGDVVNVNYSLYLDAAHEEGFPNNVNENLFNVYLSGGGSPPPRIVDTYPGAENRYLDQFTAAIIGMEVNEEKSFVVNHTDHNYGAELEGKDLYYVVKLLAIVYDSSEITSTTANENPSQTPDFGFLIAAGVGLSILVGGLLLRGYRTSQKMESVMSDRPLRAKKQDIVLKKERSQLQELRELTETISDPQEKPPDKEPVKFRRRR